MPQTILDDSLDLWNQSCIVALSDLQPGDKERTMAKKKSGGPPVNKSQAIREYLEENPDSRSVDVIDALAARGIHVSAQLVSSIRTTSTKYAVRPLVEDDELSQILHTKRYVDSVGGIDRAKRLIGALEQLR